MRTLRDIIRTIEQRRGLRRFLFTVLGFIFWRRFGLFKSILLWKEGKGILRRMQGLMR